MLRFVIAVSLLATLAAVPPVQAQITQLSDATAPPVHGVGHDYIGMLNETVNPATGALSLHIAMPVAPGRKLAVPLAFEYNSGQAWFLARKSLPAPSCDTAPMDLSASRRLRPKQRWVRQLDLGRLVLHFP